MYKISISNNFN